MRKHSSVSDRAMSLIRAEDAARPRTNCLSTRVPSIHTSIRQGGQSRPAGEQHKRCAQHTEHTGDDVERTVDEDGDDRLEHQVRPEHHKQENPSDAAAATRRRVTHVAPTFIDSLGCRTVDGRRHRLTPRLIGPDDRDGVGVGRHPRFPRHDSSGDGPVLSHRGRSLHRTTVSPPEG